MAIKNCTVSYSLRLRKIQSRTRDITRRMATAAFKLQASTAPSRNKGGCVAKQCAVVLTLFVREILCSRTWLPRNWLPSLLAIEDPVCKLFVVNEIVLVRVGCTKHDLTLIATQLGVQSPM